MTLKTLFARLRASLRFGGFAGEVVHSPETQELMDCSRYTSLRELQAKPKRDHMGECFDDMGLRKPGRPYPDHEEQKAPPRPTHFTTRMHMNLDRHAQVIKAATMHCRQGNDCDLIHKQAKLPKSPDTVTCNPCSIQHLVWLEEPTYDRDGKVKPRVLSVKIIRPGTKGDPTHQVDLHAGS